MDLPASFASLFVESSADIADLAAARIDHDVLLSEVPHWLYTGDTALHLAAAMLNLRAATLLLDAGADPNATSRRGATPLHYACDPRPNAANWNPSAQAALIELLVPCGALIDAADKGGALALARTSTGAGGTANTAAQQQEITELLTAAAPAR